MYIYGGQINSCENTNQFISYDFEKNEWALVRPKMEGDLLPIDSHTANIWEKEENKKTMIVFGGFIGGTIGDYSNAVYEYDFEQNEWKTLFENKPVDAIEITKTTVPQGRMSHAAAISNNCLYIFGGFDGNTRLNDTWSFDLVEKKWQRLGLEGFVPEVRLQLCSLIF
jgi:Kelch motif.